MERIIESRKEDNTMSKKYSKHVTKWMVKLLKYAKKGSK